MMVVLGASATDRFYVEDFTITPGETVNVSIMLDNEVEYTAFQSDLYLPEGLTATNFALTDRKNANHSLTATVLPNGGIRLLSYSLKLKPYSGNSGALVTFDVTANEEFEDPSMIALRNTLFTTEAGLEVPFDDETCTVSIPASVLRGDVDGDGNVSIRDVTALIDLLLGGNTVSNEAADVNEDHSVTITDMTALIDLLLGGN